MEANDLNKSSQPQMNLDSGNAPENKPEEENTNPMRSSEDPDPETDQNHNRETEGAEPGEKTAEQAESEDDASSPEPDESVEEKEEKKKTEAPGDSDEASSGPEKEEKPTGDTPPSKEQEAGEDQEDQTASAEAEKDTEDQKEDSTGGQSSTQEQPKGEQKETSGPPEEVNYSDLSRKELLDYYRKLMNEYPASVIKGHVEAIRKEFERQSANELARLKEAFLASGEPAEAFSPPHDELSDAMQDLIQKFRKKREEEKSQIEEEKKKNLAAKYEVIEGIKDLVNQQESLHHTFDKFRALQKRWREIGPVPANEVKDMWENYHLHVENFYNYIKINKELRDLDLKKNYEAKLELCEKAEKLLMEPSIVKAFKTLQKYHDQWREIGPVPREKKEELWERFREATIKINQKHQEYLEEQKQQLQKNLEAKKELCEKVEAVLEEDIKNPKEWEKTSKNIIELQRLWKTIGFAPKKENQEIYQRFRKACDTFFERKRDFFKRYKEEQQNNLDLKNELVRQAEALKDSTDWKNTTEELIRIQKKWKEIGPVPRKHSDAIWKRFRGACDHFFNRKSEYFGKKDEIEAENLREKEALIEELRQYEPGKNNEESFRTLQDFQRRWSEIGFVPIKEKDRVNQEFRNLINARFDHLNMDENNKALQKFRNKLENWKNEGQFRERVDQERNKIISKLKQLENDIILWENNIGFFTKSKNSESLVREFENKIENGKRNIELLNKKLDIIEEMED
ncbi:MAG: DUF349 domain-containing protein [Marinilabilia sp.]